MAPKVVRTPNFHLVLGLKTKNAQISTTINGPPIFVIILTIKVNPGDI